MTTNQVFFTSDLHLGHEFVAGLRGFASAQEHDAAIFDNWRATVPVGAIVWVLGDVILPNLQQNLAKLAELPGTKHLITGNHDKCHPHNRDSHKYRQPDPTNSDPKSYFQVFATIQEFARRKIAGQSVMLSHFPYPGGENSDHTLEPRFNQYRLRNEGLPLLHGHTHSTRVISFTYANEIPTLQIHVGLDAHGLRPVNLIQITGLLHARAGILTDRK